MRASVSRCGWPCPRDEQLMTCHCSGGRQGDWGRDGAPPGFLLQPIFIWRPPPGPPDYFRGTWLFLGGSPSPFASSRLLAVHRRAAHDAIWRLLQPAHVLPSWQPATPWATPCPTPCPTPDTLPKPYWLQYVISHKTYVSMSLTKTRKQTLCNLSSEYMPWGTKEYIQA